MSTKQRLKRIVRAINNGHLTLDNGIKNWYCYELHITECVWARNLMDGYEIDVYYHDEHIGSIELDYNLDRILLQITA